MKRSSSHHRLFFRAQSWNWMRSCMNKTKPPKSLASCPSPPPSYFRQSHFLLIMQLSTCRNTDYSPCKYISKAQSQLDHRTKIRLWDLPLKGHKLWVYWWNFWFFTDIGSGGNSNNSSSSCCMNVLRYSLLQPVGKELFALAWLQDDWHNGQAMLLTVHLSK